MVCCACCPKIFSFHLGCLFGCAFFGIIGIVIAFKASDYVKMLVADDAYSMGDGSTFAGLSHACLFFGISFLMSTNMGCLGLCCCCQSLCFTFAKPTRQNCRETQRR
eukprot:c7301_g1_i2.p1 GENE.c7301_g1_i2~~c7301_g1_i2.p1  ORF type:complete len:121 (+),score=8.92 c7301_g1_i2:44-364(+)